jgi:hypothetical protein
MTDPIMNSGRIENGQSARFGIIKQLIVSYIEIGIFLEAGSG